MDNPKFQEQLGKLVLNSGSAESSLRLLILTLCKPNEKLATRFLVPQSSMSQKIELLRRMVILEIDDENKENWFDLAHNLSILFKFRNQLFHGLPGVKDNKVYFFSTKKGKNGALDRLEEKEVNINDLININEQLESRNRQMMDFCEDYEKEIKSYLKTQSLYPLLKGKE
ncbi:hypothetical protein [Poseidonibacter lekithochrous]|uniref:hypothetical protein n=1 Tax=Poseidonibacter lekithochrous TaxID=1904463 RepID=UPI0008FCA297|nr:hypothetical protein [Poseidonibacter lekithochrous]QKJ23943.1 hypothetical protein ALEK_2718 [Poseidonibacter lekithochrous]